MTNLIIPCYVSYLQGDNEKIMLSKVHGVGHEMDGAGYVCLHSRPMVNEESPNAHRNLWFLEEEVKGIRAT